jgi:hypothetical protein
VLLHVPADVQPLCVVWPLMVQVPFWLRVFSEVFPPTLQAPCDVQLLCDVNVLLGLQVPLATHVFRGLALLLLLLVSLH